MKRLPFSALVPLVLAGVLFVAAVVLNLLPAPNPTWASDPNAGRELRQIICIAPLLILGTVLGVVGVIALMVADSRRRGG